MRVLLARLPMLVPVVAAVDAVLVRQRLPWRDLGARLFVESVLLWTAFGLLATVPAALTLRVLARRARAGARRAERSSSDARGSATRTLLGWMVLPVAVHATVERYVGLGAQGSLASARAWIEVLGVLVAGGAVLFAMGRFASRMPRWIGAAVALVATLVGVGPSLLGSRSGSDVRGMTTGGEAERPNIVLLVWDTCRSDRLSVYGYDRDTSPHLAALAEDALVFDNAVSAATFTFSSHLSMLTGVYPSTHGGRLLSTRYDPRKATTVAELLRRDGYRTGAFVGTDVLAGRTGIRYGFETYDDQVDPPVCDTYAWSLVHDLQAIAARFVPALRGNGNPHWFQDFQRPAADVLARAAKWIESGDDGRPYFCFINLYDVHWPYVPEADALALGLDRYDGPIDGYLFRSNAWTPGYEVTEEDKRHVQDLYENEIAELDRDVDAFLGRLDLDRTAIVMTSDHGEAFGEAGLWKHEDIYEPQVRIPMIVRPAGGHRVEGGATGAHREPGPVSGIDVGPTILSLAGLALPEGIDGRPLAPGIEPDRVVLVEDRDHMDPTDVRVALYRNGWKLVRRGLGDDARFELFDLANDVLGNVDVAAEHPELFAELRALLVAEREAADERDRQVEAGDGAALDGLRALGYVDE